MRVCNSNSTPTTVASVLVLASQTGSFCHSLLAFFAAMPGCTHLMAHCLAAPGVWRGPIICLRGCNCTSKTLTAAVVGHCGCRCVLTRARVRAQSYTFLDWLQVFLPCVKWLRSYRIKEFLLVRATYVQLLQAWTAVRPGRVQGRSAWRGLASCAAASGCSCGN